MARITGTHDRILVCGEEVEVLDEATGRRHRRTFGYAKYIRLLEPALVRSGEPPKPSLWPHNPRVQADAHPPCPTSSAALSTSMPHAHDVARNEHGNPNDTKAYLRRLLSPERDAWQMPDRVVRALGIEKGQTVAEIGTGPGYFTLRLSRAVGKKGTVLAVEVEPKLIEILRGRLEERRVNNVVPILALPSDPFLPPKSCDLILAVNVFHHFYQLPAYLRRLKRSLRTDGRLVNVDFHKRESPVGPPAAHRLAREDFLRAARGAGLRPTGELTFLPHQYVLTLAPANRRRVSR